MDTKELDKKFLARDESLESTEIIRTNKTYFIDSKRKKYIDFMSGWCVGNMGWGNEKIRRTIVGQSPEYVLPKFLYRPWGELAKILASITPGKLEKIFRATGGTEAVDTAMQIAMVYTGRTKFLSIEGCYHGNSIAAISIGATESQKNFKSLLPGCLKLDLPLDVNALKKAETILKKKDIAAFIMEPVIMNLAVYIPDRDFMSGMQELCRKYGTLFIMDEVGCGFGRTGKLFASEHFDLEPDVLCLAKGLSGGYGAIGATMTTAKIAKAIKKDFSVYSTFGWHPFSVNATIANLRYMLEHKHRLMDHVSRMEALFSEKLFRMKFRHGSETRMMGMAISIDVKKEKYAESIRKKCFEKGLLIDAQEEKLVFFPALTIDKKTVKKGLEILDKCL